MTKDEQSRAALDWTQFAYSCSVRGTSVLYFFSLFIPYLRRKLRKRYDTNACKRVVVGATGRPSKLMHFRTTPKAKSQELGWLSTINPANILQGRWAMTTKQIFDLR
jgi:hypothetical protein